MWREDLFRSLILFLLPPEGTDDSGVSMPVENTVYQFTSNSALELRLSQGSNHTVLCENSPLIISPSNSWSGVRDSSTNYASMSIIILTLGRNDEKNRNKNNFIVDFFWTNKLTYLSRWGTNQTITSTKHL